MIVHGREEQKLVAIEHKTKIKYSSTLFYHENRV